jgi:hypothetical protein
MTPASPASSPAIDQPTPPAPAVVLPPELRAAATANFASGITAVYGFSGAGKSSLADTAAEWAWETLGVRTFCVAMDPGGWGNKRLSLIRLGIMTCYDPSNHVNYFETMDALSQGAWPIEIQDPERGYADPRVPLVLPRRTRYRLICPQGHVAGTFDHEAHAVATAVACPTCQIVTTSANAPRIEREIVKPGIFRGVGCRIFDSLTAMSDRGLILELPSMSARGELPVGKSGGSALGSADAVRQGAAVYGTGSEAQVGFMQNRAYGWLVNIRQIPDLVVPPIVTFGVEESKDDGTGGLIQRGPRIAGKARTSYVPGWVGNCLHAVKEPDGDGRMRYRLWLTNHPDPTAPHRYIYLAKHRGTPLGMPEYLEDPWVEDVEERARLAWSRCSLRVFFGLLQQQLAQQVAQDAARYPNAPALTGGLPAGDDEIVEAVAPAAAGAAGMPSGGAIGAGAPVPVAGRAIARRGRRPTAVTAPAPAPAAPTPTSAPADGEPLTGVADVAPPAGDAEGTAPGAAPEAVGAPGVSAPEAVPIAAAPSPPAPSSRLRRVPRPPVG